MLGVEITKKINIKKYFKNKHDCAINNRVKCVSYVLMFKI